MALPVSVEDRFPEDISWGAIGGPEWFTVIATTAGGFEQRNVNWEDARGRWVVAHELKTHTQLDTLIAFFRAMRGPAIGFRFRDWSDFSTDMPATVGSAAQEADLDGLPPDGSMTHATFATADSGTTDYQLVKPYTLGSETYNRPIKKPISGAVRIYEDGVLQTEGGGADYTIDYTTGIVSFNAAFAGGEVLSWDGLFDVPVRFEDDHMPISMEHFNTSEWQGIKITELRE